jgi:protein-disulfide isomerase
MFSISQGEDMKKTAFFILILLFSMWVAILPASAAGDLPKIAVWDLSSGDIKPAYAQDLTLIMVSEISKIAKYEVYSQENVRTLAGWSAERMTLGCADTKCLTALGQMDIAKLISGRVGKIGNTYSISLNLFDTQNARAEKAVSEFCRTEDELIPLVQQAVRKLLGAPMEPSRAEGKAPEKRGDSPTSKGLETKRRGEDISGNQQIEFSKIPLDGALVMGNLGAPIKAVVFTDPQCPYCAKFHREMEEVIAQRTDVVFYIILFPLPNYKDSYWKAKSILCNKSLKMLQDSFAEKRIPRTECDPKEIDLNIRLARDLEIRGTPTTIFADGRVRSGAISARELIELLEVKK